MTALWNISLIIGSLTLFLSRRSKHTLASSPTKCYIRLPDVYIMLSLLILMCANRTGYDVRNFITFFSYVRQYEENPWDYTYEAFFCIVRWYASVFEESTYHEFHAVVVLVSGIVIFACNNKYIMNPTIVLYMYMASGIFASDGMQVKNFIAVVVLITAIPYLISSGKKYIIGLVLLLVASIMHFSFVIYFLILLIKRPLFQRVKVIFPIVGGMVYCILFLGGETLTYRLLLLLAKLPGMNKLQGYGNIFSGKRSLVIVFIYFVLLVILYLGRNVHGRLSGDAGKYAEMVWDIFLLLGITLPLSVYANAVYRLYRNMYIPLFIVMSNYIVSLPRFNVCRLGYTMAVLAAVLLLFMHPYILHQAVDIYLPVTEGSYFWMK